MRERLDNDIQIAQAEYESDYKAYENSIQVNINCVNTDNLINSARENHLALYALMEQRFDLAEEAAELRAGLDERTPAADPTQCPPALPKPAIPEILKENGIRAYSPSFTD